MDTKNETKYKLSLVIILFFILIGIIFYHFSNTPSPIKANTNKSEGSFSNALILTETNKPDSLYMEQKHNLATPDVTETGPRIEAISISSSGEPGVFIQGNFAREGDIVGGFRILKIYPDKVEFEKDGKTITGVFPSPKTGKTGNN